MEKVLIISNRNIDSFGYHLEIGFTKHSLNVSLYDYFFSKYKLIRFLIRRVWLFTKIADWLLIKKIKNIEPNFLLVTYKNIKPDIWKKIKLMGVKLIHINPDHIGTLGDQELFAVEFDLYFVKCEHLYNQMKNKLNYNVKFYEEAYNEFIHLPNNQNKIKAEEKHKIDILIMGSMYPYRMRIIQNILNKIPKKYTIKFYGNISKYTKLFMTSNNTYFDISPPIFNKKKSDLVFGSKIIINMMHIAEFKSSNAKFAEVAFIGGVQLVDANNYLKKILSSEIYELITFTDIDDLVKKSINLLENKDLRLKVSNESKKFISNRSYKNLTSKILNSYRDL